MAVSLADIGGSKVAVVLLDSSGTNPALPSPPTTEFKTALLIGLFIYRCKLKS